MDAMASWLADTQALAPVVHRSPVTIRSWAHRYPEKLPRRGTGKHRRALYDIDDARKLAAWLDNAMTSCNTETSAGVCPQTGE